MTPRRHSFRSAALLACAALLSTTMSACAPEPAPTPTPTPAFASEEEAFAAAEEVYRAYNDAFNQVVLSKPETFEPLMAFTTGEYQKAERSELSTMQAEEYVRGGEIKIVNFTPSEFDGTEVLARTCNDVSSTTFTDADGTSLIPPDRPSFVALDLVFQVSGGSVRLSRAVPVEDDTCVS